MIPRPRDTPTLFTLPYAGIRACLGVKPAESSGALVPDHLRDATKMAVDPTTRPQDRARLSRQCEQVLAWLQAGEVLTAAVAWERGVQRLAARCHDLKAAGYPVTTTIERGSGTAEYRLGEGKG